MKVEIENLFDKWEMTHNDTKEDANCCTYGKELVMEFAELWLEKRLSSVEEGKETYTREMYDERVIPSLFFTKDYTVNNSVLFLKGEEYSIYNWNYSRMVELLKQGVITSTPIQEEVPNKCNCIKCNPNSPDKYYNKEETPSEGAAIKIILDYTASSKWSEISNLNWTTVEVTELINQALSKESERIGCCMSCKHWRYTQGEQGECMRNRIWTEEGFFCKDFKRPNQ